MSSTPNVRLVASAAVLTAFLASAPAEAQTVTATYSKIFQTMDGWGASTGYLAANVNFDAARADLFFSHSAGIGLEYVRTTNTADRSMPDLPTVKLAVARGAKVLLSMYSAPASM